VLASNSVSFHSDEAIVGLMARHINAGKPIPVFFYGQPYMGSLDPLLVSLAFRIFGESVLSIRLVQSALYLGIVGSGMMVAYRLTNDRRVAELTGILFAIPPVVMTLYTTISLGGYGEVLILGNLLLLAAYELTQDRAGWRSWLALGALAGLGWWTNNLIAVYVLPAALFWAYRAYRNSSLLRAGLRWNPLAVIAFFIFSAPWWLYNLSHNWESIRFLTGGFQSNASAQPVGFMDKVGGFFLIGLPAAMGLRFPWQVLPWSGIITILTFILYGVMLLSTLLFSKALIVQGKRDAVLLAWLMITCFAVIFSVSGFGVDSTGRYLLPILMPMFLLIALQIRSWEPKQRWVPALLCMVMGVNLVGNVAAMRTVPPGLTPQFDPTTDFPNDSDQEVIRFLVEHGGTRGYATYWVSYRLAFLSGESVILTPMLPYKGTLIFTPVDRYPPYDALVESADRPVLVTGNLPQLDQIIEQRLGGASVTFREQKIGPYTVFYELSRLVTPAALGLQSLGADN